MNMRYSKLAQLEPSASSVAAFDCNNREMAAAFNFDTIFTYAADSDQPRHKYASIFSYTSERINDELAIKSPGVKGSTVWQAVFLFLAYACFILTLPFSLVLCLKRVRDHENLLLFRLGHLKRPKGPGLALIFPCIDRWTIVDLKMTTVNIATMQVITLDGGVVEFSGRALYQIVNPISAVTRIQDPTAALEALVKTIFHNETNKTRLQEIIADNERLLFTNEITKQLNKVTLPWGIEFKDLQILNLNVIKKSNPPLAGLFGGIFGGAPSANNISGGENVFQNLVSFFQNSDDHFQGQTTSSLSSSVVQHATAANVNTISEQQPLSMDSIVALISPLLSEALTQQIGLVFQLHVLGIGDLVLDLKNGKGCVSPGSSDQAACDISLSARDCSALVTGRLAALEAYVTGRVKVKGDLKHALKLELLKDAYIRHSQLVLNKSSHSASGFLTKFTTSHVV